MDEDGAASLDRVLDEADGARQLLSDVLPGHVHHADYLILNFGGEARVQPGKYLQNVRHALQK